MASCGCAKLVGAFVDAVLVPIVFQLEICCEAKLILARVGKKQCSYFVVAWLKCTDNFSPPTLKLIYIYSGPFKTRGMSVSKHTSFPLFRA